MIGEMLDEKAIFNVARTIEAPEARAAYLRQACSGDAELIERIQSLLRGYEEQASFLESPPVSFSPPRSGEGLGEGTIDSPLLTERPGTIIGPYKLLQQIGEGGMGVVFMAEQTKPIERTVALKIIKPGMDTRQVIARFEAERQALAMMDHPNIAKVLDAGMTAPASGYPGRPYFVMELVKGVPITEFCDERQLSVRDRMELLLPVCEAVQHAHQKGIIHRDIKPTNVLVAEYDNHAVPKVIDFGVAKATAQKLTERTMFTEFGQVIGTVEYMSPEQAKLNQLDIDTRSDIYSLGVLLYELLTGSTPFERNRLREAALDEVLRIIREEEPPKPSTRLSSPSHAGEGRGEGALTLASIAANRHTEPTRLSKDVCGELDWIVMKCLEKDRNRRYETANGFAMDIRRYLHDEAVLACPPSAAYRFRKFARKNKRLLATVTALGTLLVLATIGAVLAAVQSGWLAEKEQQLRSAADQRADAEAKARKDLDKRLYVNRIALAQQELFAQNTGRAQELLDECPVQLRGWEWYFLKQFRPGNPITLEGAPNGAEFSPDGRYLAHNLGNNIHIVDPLTGGTIRILRGHLNEIHHLAFHPITANPSILASTGRHDGIVRIWNVDTGQEIRALAGHSPRLRAIVFSPDGKRLAAGSIGGGAKVWDWSAGRLVFEVMPQEGISRLAYSPDGRHLAVGHWGDASNVTIFDAATGGQLRSFGKHDGGLESVAYNSNGQRLATCGYDGTVKVWDEATGNLLRTLRGHNGPVADLAYDHKDQRIASAGWDKTVKIWDPETGQELLTLRGHTEEVEDLAFSNGGDLLVSAGRDGVRVWNATLVGAVAGSEAVTLSGHTSFVTTVAFSPDGRHLATAGSDQLLQLWDVASLGQPGAAKSVWREKHTHRIMTVTFSPNSRRVASAGWGKELKIRDVASARVLLALKAGRSVRSVRFSPDGRNVACLSQTLTDSTMAVWDATTGQDVFVVSLPTGNVYSLEYSPDGRYLAINQWGLIKIWDAATGKEIRTIEAHRDETWSVAYSPDGRRLASASFDHSIKIWDTTDWNEIRTLRGHTDRVMSVAFSPDGNRLASGSADSTVKVWDAASGQELATFRGHTGYVWSAAFSPDGRWLTSAGGHYSKGEVKVWDLASTLDVVNRPVAVENARRQAAEFYEMLATAQPKVWEHRRSLGHAYAQQDQWDKAAVAFKKAIELTPQDGNIWNTLGVARYRAGDWQPAIEALGKSIELRAGGDASDWFFLAMAHRQLGDKDQARTWFDKAVEWSVKNQPKNEELLHFRAEAAELLGITEPRPTPDKQPPDDQAPNTNNPSPPTTND
jgi:WD40 repeat protein/serine/threonine protein kinase